MSNTPTIGTFGINSWHARTPIKFAGLCRGAKSLHSSKVAVTASWNGLTAACVVECQPAVFIGTVVGVETGLNVRSGGGTEYPVTGSLTNGSQVVVVAITKGGWYHIHYLHRDGYAAEGYVSGDYLQLNRG